MTRKIESELARDSVLSVVRNIKYYGDDNDNFSIRSDRSEALCSDIISFEFFIQT